MCECDGVSVCGLFVPACCVVRCAGVHGRDGVCPCERVGVTLGLYQCGNDVLAGRSVNMGYHGIVLVWLYVPGYCCVHVLVSRWL